MSLGTVLKARRLAQGMTGLQAVEAANGALSLRTLKRLEADDVTVGVSTFVALCAGMGVEAWDVLRQALRPDMIVADRAELEQLQEELERERMCHAACGVLALANTRGSAAQVRNMRPEYWSASVQEVARAVDREMALREQLERVRKILGPEHPAPAPVADWPFPLTVEQRNDDAQVQLLQEALA